MAILSATTFTAAPSLIFVVVVLFGLAPYQGLTGRDRQKAADAIATIRRCRVRTSGRQDGDLVQALQDDAARGPA